MVGPSPNRPAREIDRLRAARAREHDDGVSRCGALSSAALTTERAMRPSNLSSRGPRRDNQRARAWCWVLARTALPARASSYAPLAPESAINAIVGSPSDTPQSCRCEVLIEPRASPRRIEGGGVVLGPTLNHPAREINRLRAARARERDKRDDGVAIRHASELSVRSTHRAEGLAATNRGRERGAGPYPKSPCPREQPTRAR